MNKYKLTILLGMTGAFVATNAQAQFKKPVFQKPVVQKPVFQKPVFQKPVVQKPVFQKPVNLVVPGQDGQDGQDGAESSFEFEFGNSFDFSFDNIDAPAEPGMDFFSGLFNFPTQPILGAPQDPNVEKPDLSGLLDGIFGGFNKPKPAPIKDIQIPAKPIKGAGPVAGLIGNLLGGLEQKLPDLGDLDHESCMSSAIIDGSALVNWEMDWQNSDFACQIWGGDADGPLNKVGGLTRRWFQFGNVGYNLVDPNPTSHYWLEILGNDGLSDFVDFTRCIIDSKPVIEKPVQDEENTQAGEDGEDGEDGAIMVPAKDLLNGFDVPKLGNFLFHGFKAPPVIVDQKGFEYNYELLEVGDEFGAYLNVGPGNFLSFLDGYKKPDLGDIAKPDLGGLLDGIAKPDLGGIAPIKPVKPDFDGFDFDFTPVKPTPVKPKLGEFDFDFTPVKPTPVKPKLGEFDFDFTPVKPTPVKPKLGEFDFELPPVKPTPVKPKLGEFDFDFTPVKPTPVVPKLGEFDFELPPVKPTPVKPNLGEFDLDFTPVKPTPVVPKLGEFDFDLTPVKPTPVKPNLGEFDFDGFDVIQPAPIKPTPVKPNLGEFDFNGFDVVQPAPIKPTPVKPKVGEFDFNGFDVIQPAPIKPTPVKPKVGEFDLGGFKF